MAAGGDVPRGGMREDVDDFRPSHVPQRAAAGSLGDISPGDECLNDSGGGGGVGIVSRGPVINQGGARREREREGRLGLIPRFRRETAGTDQ